MTRTVFTQSMHEMQEEMLSLGSMVEKADPFAFRAEEPPKTASIVHREEFKWHDQDWMETRATARPLQEAVSVYELHMGSWRRDARGMSLSYREVAEPLVPLQREAIERVGVGIARKVF